MTLTTAAQFETQLVTALNQIDPQINTMVGSPIRKVLESVARQAAAISVNQTALADPWDLDAKSGTELDAFASFLGFGRRQGKKAQVSVEFLLTSPATSAISIPRGLTVSDGTHEFQTLQAASIPVLSQSVSVPCEAQSTGSAFNVQAYTITTIGSGLSGSQTVSCQNPQAAAGGADAETDAQLRARIKATFLRNLAGTSDAYRNIALNVGNTERVTVLGPQNVWYEQETLESTSDGLGFTSNIPCSKYTYPDSGVLSREGVSWDNSQFTMSTDNPPTVTITPTDGLDLSNLSGASLDAAGQAIGLSRNTGSQAEGAAVIAFLYPQPSAYTLPAGTILSFEGNQFKTLAASTIASQDYSGSPVPVQAVNTGTETVPVGSILTLPNRPQFTAQCSTEVQGGSAPWSDSEYRTELEDYYAQNLGLSEGDVVWYQHSYCSVDSRNEPSQNVLNRVDVYSDGQNIQLQTLMGQIAFTQADSSLCSTLWDENGGHPVEGQMLLRIPTAPLEGAPTSITVDGASYTSADYTLYKTQGNTRGSIQEESWLGWNPGSSLPAAGSFWTGQFPVNQVVSSTQTLLENNKQIGTDILAHEAHRVGLTINLLVELESGVNPQTTYTSIVSALSDYVDSLSYGDWIRVNQLVKTVLSVTGVQDCQLNIQSGNSINMGENIGQPVAQGVQTTEQWEPLLNPSYTSDFRLWDCMTPVLQQVNCMQVGSNTLTQTPIEGTGESPLIAG